MTFQLSAMSTMWSKAAHVRSYFETTLKKAINLDHMVMTIRDTGAGPSLDNVTSFMRSGLRIAHENMADNMKKFVESNVIFSKHPHFYHELITLEVYTYHRYTYHRYTYHRYTYHRYTYHIGIHTIGIHTIGTKVTQKL